jgi:putative transposase
VYVKWLQQLRADTITVLGLTVHGQKVVLGLRQGATETATVVKQLLADLQER